MSKHAFWLQDVYGRLGAIATDPNMSNAVQRAATASIELLKTADGLVDAPTTAASLERAQAAAVVPDEASSVVQRLLQRGFIASPKGEVVSVDTIESIVNIDGVHRITCTSGKSIELRGFSDEGMMKAILAATNPRTNK